MGVLKGLSEDRKAGIVRMHFYGQISNRCRGFGVTGKEKTRDIK